MRQHPLACRGVRPVKLMTEVANQRRGHGGEMRKSGLNGIVPGLQLTRTAGFENIATFRGVGSQTPEEAPVTVAGVALFVDDVYISNTISLNQTLFDVDRIEVLRGPQGALYGQSSPGGAILVKSRQPEFGVMS